MNLLMKDLLQTNYGYLFEDDLLEEINKVGELKHIKAGEKLI